MNKLTSSDDDLENKGILLITQIIMLPILFAAWIGTRIISHFFPNFFNYPYIHWGGWESVWKFWPLFAWGALLALLGSISRLSDRPIFRATDRNAHLGLGLITSLLAGFWEELGYRFIFICYAMTSIFFFNWLFGVGIGWILFLALAGIAIAMFLHDEHPMSVVVGLIAILLALLLIHLSGSINIVYWLNSWVVTIVHFTTIGKMDSVLYGGYDKLFIFGAILANAWFRDGHKYQGTFGVINAWYAGMILLYATLTYGLITAIVIHAAYDIIFDVAMYLVSHVQEAARERFA